MRLESIQQRKNVKQNQIVADTMHQVYNTARSLVHSTNINIILSKKSNGTVVVYRNLSIQGAEQEEGRECKVWLG